MVVSDVILGELPVVFLLFLSQEVYGVTLLQQYIAHIFFISQDMFNTGQSPFWIPPRRQYVSPFQGFLDLTQAAAQQEQVKNHFDMFCFFRHNLRLSVLSFFIAQHILIGKGEISLTVPFSFAPFNIVAQRFAFALGESTGPCEEYFACYTGGVQSFFFKPDDNAPILEHSYVRNALQGISGKSG